MPELDFPTSPTNGQYYQGYVWNSTNGTWDSSYQVDTLKPSLTQMVATTVAVSGGTATANTLGTISFTAATGIQLNGVFTSVFDNYRVVISGGNSATGEIRVRFTSGGTQQSGANYRYGMGRAATNVFDNYGANGNTYFPFCQSGTATLGSFNASFDVMVPKVSNFTGFVAFGNGHDGTNATSLFGAGHHNVSVSNDGLYIYPTTGNFSGTVSVYGYAK